VGLDIFTIIVVKRMLSNQCQNHSGPGIISLKMGISLY